MLKITIILQPPVNVHKFHVPQLNSSSPLTSALVLLLHRESFYKLANNPLVRGELPACITAVDDGPYMALNPTRS